ncbi:MAG: hypothetical protein JXR71_00840 [Bacteroidales bacterium]|nr:hypothetical protein [Bacteroidales bacterium]
MAIEFRKDPNYPDSILIRRFSGEVGLKEIIESWDYLLGSGMLNPNVKGVINDLSVCDLNMNMDDFRELMYYLKTKDIFLGVKLAVVCNDPKQIVFPVMGEMKEKGLKIRPFSLEEAAEEWIMLT